MDETALLEKLKRIEALFEGAGTPGEAHAASEARTRLLARLEAMAQAAPPREFRFTLNNSWSRTLFVALLRRYSIAPYRFRGQRHNTVMARVSDRFCDETLWPEFQQLDAVLQQHLDEVTQRIIKTAVHQDSSEAQEVEKPLQLT